MSRNIPPSLTALGRRTLPDTIEVLGKDYQRACIYKNDFFAITAMYENRSNKVILKFHRRAWFLIFPMDWICRLLASREQTPFEQFVCV